jgi:hypothetical protein
MGLYPYGSKFKVQRLLPTLNFEPKRSRLDPSVYPPSQKATGVNPWMNARWVPAVALAKVGALRRVPPHEVSGEVPRP